MFIVMLQEDYHRNGLKVLCFMVIEETFSQSTEEGGLACYCCRKTGKIVLSRTNVFSHSVS